MFTLYNKVTLASQGAKVILTDLAPEEVTYITGSTLYIDGGYLAQ